MDTLGEGPRLPKVRPRKLMDEGILGCLDLGAQLTLHCSLNFETAGVSRASFWKKKKNRVPNIATTMGRGRRLLLGLWGLRYRSIPPFQVVWSGERYNRSWRL